jgi:NitT/TauT family transport system substrate-binding protein
MKVRGKFELVVCLLALTALGAWKWRDRSATQPDIAPDLVETAATDPAETVPETNATALPFNPSGAAASSPLLAEAKTEVPTLPPAGIYEPKNNILEIELSEYAGYAGLVVANGGLEPTENSEFFRKGGFKVKFTLNEVESRGSLHSGKLAALATTVDALPLFGRQFEAVAPAQISFSRGADGVVVRQEIKRINHLKGRVLAAAQFTESDYFIRFLAEAAGLGIQVLPSLKVRPNPGRLNVVYCQDAFSAGDLFLQDLQDGSGLLAGCVTWAPKTVEIAAQSKGQAYILADSLNLLVLADILAINKGFARQHPEKVTVLVAGLLEGNRKVQADQNACLDIIGKVFGWDREKTKSELAMVHLSNLPENLAFFSGVIEAAGSYTGIYQSALKAYGKDLIKKPTDGAELLELKHLKAIEKSGAFAVQSLAIAPLHAPASAVPGSPLLSKDIRFLFEPNTFTLQLNLPDNQRNLESIKQLLQVSPGSTVLLRGHVDNAMVEEFRKKGGDKFVRQTAERALDLSKHRALEIRRLLVERYDFDLARIETIGLGWNEPLGSVKEQNRRVEVHWFTYK